MAIPKAAWTRRVASILWACGLLALAGCGSRFKLFPVAGNVTVDGQPLTAFRLSFVPDVAKGNTTPVACGGRIDQQGRYHLGTIAVRASDNGAGVPLGWYKVIVIILAGDPPANFDSVYTDVDKTPLSVEVVDKPEPGHYDLKLARAKNVRPKPPAERVSPKRKQERDEQKSGGA
jgi:hypothetical protein